MPPRALNEENLPGNACFGCGPANPEGLQIRIYRDGDRSDRLVGTWTPRATAEGFPRIAHGGLQFTALDCMAGWVALVLRSPGQMMPLTKSASMRYLRPATTGTLLSLSAQVTRENATPREPCLIHGEIRDPAGTLLSEGDFEYVFMPNERFLQAVGLQALPEGYRQHFERLE